MKILLAILFLVALLWLYLINADSVAKGVVEGGLAVCSEKPNCVCSCDPRKEKFIQPFPLLKNPLEKLEAILKEEKRGKVIKKTESYLHIEFRTFLGFVDDLEFFVDKESAVVHVRSGSRAGYYDMGVNRLRVEGIRELYGRR